jgi:hypothetical protein
MTEKIDVRRLRPGDRVRTVDGATAVVLQESQDGEWILVRYESAKDEALVGSEDLCSGSDLDSVMSGSPN